MGEIVNLEELRNGLEDLTTYFESKGYHRIDTILLCNQFTLIAVAEFSIKNKDALDKFKK